MKTRRKRLQSVLAGALYQNEFGSSDMQSVNKFGKFLLVHITDLIPYVHTLHGLNLNLTRGHLMNVKPNVQI